MPLLEAFERTEFSVRPSFKPITLVGVFCLANVRSWDTSFFVQAFPVFLVDLVIALLQIDSSKNEWYEKARVMPDMFVWVLWAIFEIRILEHRPIRR